MDVSNTGLLLVDGHEDIFLDYFPVGLASHGVDRDLAEISGAHQIVERLRGLLLVECVLRDDGAQCREIGAEDGFAGLND